MKVVNTLVKVLTALAAVAGAVYVIATYGEQIVAWCKKTLANLPKCPCTDCECDGECKCEGECECQCEAAEEPAVEEPAEEAVEEVVVEETVEEAPVEEEPAAEEPAEEAVVADDEDFVG